MIRVLTSVIIFFAISNLAAQNAAVWTESDRTYIVDNLTRSIQQIEKETNQLTEAQWTFKPAADKWSINQVVEHIAIWELLLEREISLAMYKGPQPEFKKTVGADSTSLNFIMETKPHHSLDYTKPFSFTIPMGLNKGSNNILWLKKLRKEGIDFAGTTKDDLRAFFRNATDGNVHQIYILIFGHADRHLRQIMKIKSDAAYPR